MRHRTIALTLLFGYSFLLLGCDPSFTRADLEPPDQLAVTAVFDPSESTHGVKLTTIGGTGVEDDGPAFVNDATVELGGVRLRNRPDPPLADPEILTGRANYLTDDLDIQAGTAYDLTVDAGAQSLQGRVQVPGPFSVFVSGRRISWTPSEGAASYEVRASGATVTYTPTVRDTTVVLGDSDEDFREGRYTIEITALDANLTTFLDTDQDRAGVTGGYGLVGALTSVRGQATLPAVLDDTQGKRQTLDPLPQ